MSALSTPRRLGLLLSLAVAIGIPTGTLAMGRSEALPEPVAELPAPVADDGQLRPVAGTSEKILIVVAGDYATVAEANAAYQPFGEMQGFYVAASDDYQVIGVYDQATPNFITVPCAAAPNDLKGYCTPGLSNLKVNQPVALRYVPAAAARGFVEGGSPCGRGDLPPCVRDRLGELLTPDLQLRPGRQLLLSAFRTKAGAAQFAETARAAGYEDVVVLRVVKTGNAYDGLGQEAHPDGVSGPLTAPLPDPDPYQE